MRILRIFQKFKTKDTPGIMITKIIPDEDPRSWTAAFKIVEQEEIQRLLFKNVFKIAKKSRVTHGADTIRGQFVSATKNVNTNEEKYKDQFVVQGRTDSERNMIVHASNKIRHQTMRIIVSVDAICRVNLWTKHVSQAYLRSHSKLSRDIYV